MFLQYNLDIKESSVWKMASSRQEEVAPPFSITEIGHFYANNGYFTVRENKPDYLLIFTVSGTGLLSYGNSKCMLSRGDAVFIDCNQRHEYHTFSDEEAGWEFYWMHIATTHGQFYLNALYPNEFSAIRMGNTTEIIGRFQKTLEGFDTPLRWNDCEQSGFVSSLLTRLAELQNEESPGTYPRMEDIARAALYITENYKEKLSLETLSSVARLSKYHFLRLFKKQMQTTPYQFLLHTRINEAKKILRTTNCHVSEISELAGFSDESHFIRTFKQLTAITPQQYRKNC